MTLRARRGMALAVAIFALVAVAALVHATVAPAVAHRRAVSRLVAFQQAETRAERAVAGVLREWSPERWRAMPVGAVVDHAQPADAPAPASGAVTTLRVARLSRSIFLLRAEASMTAANVPVVARRVLFLELRAAPVPAGPALTLGGGLSAGPADVIEVGDECATDSVRAPAVMVAPWSQVSWANAASQAAVYRDSAAARRDTYDRAAGLDVAALRARADVRLEAGAVVAPVPVVEDGRCAAADRHWGEPLRGGAGLVTGCVTAYPVVAAAGDLRIAGGRGQGVLLVEGRLRISGPFVFSGLIVAPGGVETDGDEVTLEGAVYAGPDAGATLGALRSTIRRSACALRDVAAAHAVLGTVPFRAWGR